MTPKSSICPMVRVRAISAKPAFLALLFLVGGFTS
jgi:hypothetical protein